MEFQQRGSVHVHGLAWIRGQPMSKQDTDFTNPELQERILRFFGPEGACHLQAHFFADVPASADHPSARTPERILEVGWERDLKELINRVQQHRFCLPGYCLRNKNVRGPDGKRIKVPFCRFNFPRAPVDELEIYRNPARNGQPELRVPRTDSETLASVYFEPLSRAWRANTDVQAVVSLSVVHKYVKKHRCGY